MNCEGKVAVVTGAAGGGLGRSIALTLAREGARVAVNYRTSRESAEAIVRHIQSCGGSAAQENTRERGDTGGQVDHHVVTRHRLADGRGSKRSSSTGRVPRRSSSSRAFWLRPMAVTPCPAFTREGTTRRPITPVGAS